MTDQNTASIGARLDRLPISKIHWYILAVVGAGAFVDAFDIYLAGGVIAAMIDEGFATVDSSAIFMSATFIGMMIGALAGGLFGDRFGRKASFQVNLLVFGIASIAAVFAPNIESLIALRIVMGLGLGAELVVAIGMLSEFTPPMKRGRWAAMMSTVIAAGLPVASLVGLIVIPNLGWRYMFAIAGVGAFVVLAARRNLPESPRWLESRGRYDEADRIVTEFERRAREQHGSLPEPAETNRPEVESAPVWALFRPGVLPRLLLAILLFVTINVTVYGFVSWLPTLLVERGLSVVDSLGYTTVMSVGAVAGSLFCVLLADKIGRTTGIIGAALVTVVSGIAYAFSLNYVLAMVIGFILVSAVYFLVALGQFGYVPELFPTPLRLRGTGISSGCGRAAAIVMPFITVALMTEFGAAGVIAFVSLLMVILVVSLSVYRLETSKRSLESVQAGVSQQDANLRETGINVASERGA